MFFDDVGLMSPLQVERLSKIVSAHDFDTWRAFTHAYLVVKHNELLIRPFIQTGGKRIGMGLETGSQRSLDLINKRNGKKQAVDEHILENLLPEEGKDLYTQYITLGRPGFFADDSDDSENTI